MFFFLWIFAIIVCFVITLFPIRVEDSINKQKDVLFFVEKFVEYLLIACTYVLIVSNRTQPDIINYQYGYIGAISLDSSREILYKFLSSTSYNIGLNFFQFRNVLVLLSGVCFIFAMKMANVKISSVLLFYLPVVMFMDSSQFRNSICLYVLLLAVHLLNDSKNFIFFIVVVLILSQIHSAYIVYLILLGLFLRDQKRKYFLCGIFGVSLIVCALTFMNGNRVPFVNDFFAFFLSSSDERVLYALSTGRFGFLYPLGVHSITLVLLLFLKGRTCLANRDDFFVKCMIGLMTCSYVIVPFIMMNMNYYRIIRNAYVASLIAFMVIYREQKNDVLGKIMLLGGLAMVTGLWGFFEMGIYDSIDVIANPILKDGVWFLDNETGVLR
ncbi:MULTISPECIES: EpsG family protein [unclassified Fibrobacter]|uniref:EpsG family protein n=1 Tax=unclassified Fibrobacter TaxID=2634177 RepID=UPI0009166F61|nr:MULTISPECIES: EpsG family protein [unclassified Fibrobacter]OWV05270.1 hypothetical protein B7993_08315 [Fibrobacter sp. UWH3]SHL30944.1 EpsG family protein [Fibrobacter sp. UWH6]